MKTPILLLLSLYTAIASASMQVQGTIPPGTTAGSTPFASGLTTTPKPGINLEGSSTFRTDDTDIYYKNKEHIRPPEFAPSQLERKDW